MAERLLDIFKFGQYIYQLWAKSKAVYISECVGTFGIKILVISGARALEEYRKIAN